MDDSKELNLRRALNDLGYDDARISEMFENAYTVCGWIESYLELYNQADTVYFYDDVNTYDMNLSVPMADILESLEGQGSARGFMAEESFYVFINDVFTADNLPLIKDYLLVSSFWILPYTAYEIPFDETNRGYDYSYNVMRTVIGYTPDMIADEYIKRYGADMSTTEINSYILSIKTASVKVIDDIDWLSDETKELAKQKISRMGQYIGQNGHRNLLNDYELTGEPVADLLALRVNAKHFERNQTFYVQDSRAPYGNELMSGSAFYIKYMNCLVITPYELCDPMFTDALTDEERLAYFGETLAHEIGHSSDMNGISYRWDGLYEPIVSEDDMEAYQEKLGLISDFFDGRETYFGNTINGSRIVNEAYADLFAIRVCLNILAEKENADYDLFFRTYAKATRGFYFEQDADRFLNDTHLMAKDRINLILGQFDEFYETYDIDVTSPYYVPEDQRLDIF
jgi:predicted metalloendopeptidase